MMVGLAALTSPGWPYRARMLYNWDAVQFALALREFDVAKHQPHPPGYLLYVALGRLLEHSSGRSERSPTSRSPWSSALPPPWPCTGSPARSTIAPPPLPAATLLAVSPLFWFYGSVGLTYAGEAFVRLAGGVPSRMGRFAATPRRSTAARWLSGSLGGIRQSVLGAALSALRRLRVPRCPEPPPASYRRRPHGGGRALVVSRRWSGSPAVSGRTSAPRPSSTARWCFRPRCSAARWT